MEQFTKGSSVKDKDMALVFKLGLTELDMKASGWITKHTVVVFFTM